jgi:hypothetical protein
LSPKETHADDDPGRHRARHSELEKHANEFAASALRAATYLNGGGLVALPTAAALFKIDLDGAGKFYLIAAGLCFIVGLVAVVACWPSRFLPMPSAYQRNELVRKQQQFQQTCPDRRRVRRSEGLIWRRGPIVCMKNRTDTGSGRYGRPVGILFCVGLPVWRMGTSWARASTLVALSIAARHRLAGEPFGGIS